jgi:hypothetical protein
MALAKTYFDYKGDKGVEEIYDVLYRQDLINQICALGFTNESLTKMDRNTLQAALHEAKIRKECLEYIRYHYGQELMTQQAALPTSEIEKMVSQVRPGSESFQTVLREKATNEPQHKALIDAVSGLDFDQLRVEADKLIPGISQQASTRQSLIQLTCQRYGLNLA